MSLTIDVLIENRHRYPYHIGGELWKDFGNFCRSRYPSKKLLIIIDENVNDLHGSDVRSHCSSYFEQLRTFVVPEGEESKSVGQWNKLLEQVLDEGVERSTPVLAVGGGVVGDLAGFVAASALRGLPLVHMPTSLLAMVDSSIGGKTGVNHSTGKNHIGAFYQPDAVFVMPDFLETLPGGEWVNGLSEIIKYAAISDPGLFDLIDDCVEAGFEPASHWVDLVRRSAAIKIDVVQKDTLESGMREFLNFGHTFGHALEKNAGYGTISHGEAVLIGMAAAAHASHLLGSEVHSDRIFEYLPLYNIDLPDEVLDVEKLVETMKKDKKVKDGRIRLVLLNRWGDPYIHACDGVELVGKAWSFALEKIQ